MADQIDYGREVLGFQHRDWDQSNWVILDFSNLTDDPEAYVGKKLIGGSVKGIYAEGKNNGGNYRIVLSKLFNAEEDAEAAKYPGYGVAIPANSDPEKDDHYTWYYNTYGPANFVNANLNQPYGNGFVAGDDALGTHKGEKLFFMNPKAQEVVRISAVYAGNNRFTVYRPSVAEGVNGWAQKGSFTVNWDYNRVDQNNYGVPNLSNAENLGYIFHAVVVRKSDSNAPGNAPRRSASADQDSPASDMYDVYPLDFSSAESNKTAVNNVQTQKSVVSVRYYNVMGMESEQPFEGINIVVTRYSDGSASTFKVLR